MIYTAKDLIAFARRLELSGDYVLAITGFNIHRFRRGRSGGKVELSPHAAAKLERLEALYQLGLRLCREEAATIDWLYAESPTLGGRSPIDEAETDAGFQKVRVLVEALVGPVTTQAALPAKTPISDSATAPVVAPKSEILPEKARIAEGLQRAFKANPEITQASLARRAQAAGLEGIAGSRISRLLHGYSDASSEEILALAKVLGISASELMRR